jgi:hypothetical protein
MNITDFNIQLEIKLETSINIKIFLTHMSYKKFLRLNIKCLKKLMIIILV